MSQEELRRRELRRKFTVRVNTFRRNDLLKQVVEHYVSCPRIDARKARATVAAEPAMRTPAATQEAKIYGQFGLAIAKFEEELRKVGRPVRVPVGCRM